MLDLNNENTRKGALDALSMILDSRKRKIKVKQKDTDDEQGDDGIPELKLPKNSEIITNGAESDGENNDDELDDAEEQETAEERQARIDRLNNTVEDQEALETELANIALDNEERENKKVRASQAAARKAAMASGRSLNGIQDFSVFVRDLDHAMKKQTTLTTKPEDTYAKMNPTYAHTDLLMPGSGYKEKRTIPIINVYWDESGSLYQSDKEKGRDALSLLLRLQARKKIKVKNYWFADNVADSPEGTRGATGAFPEILKHIKETKATNVIIFTDSDFNRQTNFSKIAPIDISGCVWWIWCGSAADKAVPYIKPRTRGNVFEYRMR